jgi:hypothetical protein
LQIFDDGHLTDAKGRRVDFRNSLIIMTSNFGAVDIKRGSLGFAQTSDEAKVRERSYEKMKDALLNKLKDTRESNFRPEFLNRIDDIVVFHTLTEVQIRSIVDMMMGNVSKQLAEKEIKLVMTDASKDYLGKEGYKEEYGARQLRRVIQNKVEDKLSEEVLRGGLKTFKRVYETKATSRKLTVTENLLKAIKGIPEKRVAENDKYRMVPEILTVDHTDDTITVYSTESLKFDMEKIIREHMEETKKEEVGKRNQAPVELKVTENAYVSEVVIDVKDGEIIIDSRNDLSISLTSLSAVIRDNLK